ncbi:MAG TPA: endonuclease/exonuclease/phosphatase family protein [Phycisphaerae bacterium]|jgi:endonuclease/exonuclease/phosphatase family metal-dependent hydrolase|nr:endonuclease [Phycisphaerae bacterium]HOB73930.1 endonuclease/exonuclease/phosphatase family protein [Phycisphaerae bacterium]HOJ56272.1 endonuclease/exonuclease/phosphatase family protein [Phycisphaerae bacterium]HOL28136.1 endonuclease/exonuclease/phosphatase family protein [Phycisphaerae bacterium]HPP19753.1 endonuclease/exonuclease/phosphatase family protein [Phycisphaerae bacterium]
MSKLIRFLIVVILFTTGCSRPQPVVLRVLSYNIHHAEGLDKQLDLERIARIINESGADLVALQEVDRNVKRSGNVDQPARLAELTGMTSIFEKNIDLQGGEYGNAILSRLPVESYRHHFLPRRGNNEQRGLLQARVRTAAGPLIFMATHLDHQADDAERMDSVAMIRVLAGEHAGQPLILAGDLNTAPDTRVLGELRSFLFDTCPPDLQNAFTFSADRPRERIDYILYNRDPRLRVTDYRILDEPVASDHRPVLATFLIQRGAVNPKANQDAPPVSTRKAVEAASQGEP